MNKPTFLSLFLTITFVLNIAHAQMQIDTMQDRSELEWAKIESENFQVIFPTDMEAKAQYILNLLEFYKEPTAATYDIQTRKYPIIVRSELASPNGFVTLMPRRSEFYSASAISPLVSSLEWHQSLAVHEYRHMVQFDFIKRNAVRWGYWLFGDLGGAALMGATAPPWYFEGDAVWAETVLSDAGRGRSPRFDARMKSLLIHNELPTYDELIGGVYTTVLPNHYVYGYFLIARAAEVYGEKVWRDVINAATHHPLNLYTFYNAFKRVTGDDFADFYQATLKDLQAKWAAGEDQGGEKRSRVYTRYEYPMVDEGKLYFLKWDLDSFWSLYELRHQREIKIKELNVSPAMSRVDLKRGLFVYAQQLPHPRWGYRSYSDIFLLDLETGKQKQITIGSRAYHPQLHPRKDELLAVEFIDSKKYELAIYDFDGERLDSLALDGHDIAEAVWIGPEQVAAVILDAQGEKNLVVIDLVTRQEELIGPAGRNNVYAMQFHQNKLYFEADIDGTVNIMSIDLESDELSQRSQETIAAYRPFPSGDKLYYVAEAQNGQVLRSIPLDAPQKAPGDFTSEKAPGAFLPDYGNESIYNYEVKSIDNFEELFVERWKTQDFFEMENGLSPHTWSFIGDRGFQLMGMSQNYLNTFSATATIGQDANESRPFAELSFNYRKYYPILSLNLGYQERFADEDEWTEARIGLAALLPYAFRRNLYSGSHSLSFSASNVEISERKNANTWEINDDRMLLTSVGFSTSLFKDLRYRELWPEWGYSFRAQYINARASENKSFSSYLGFAGLDLYAPGVGANHGTKLSFLGEYRTENRTSYRIASPANASYQYALSRGYGFAYVDSWNKASLNYLLPLAYPNLALGRWLYFNRVYTTLFFDHTNLDVGAGREFALNSTGAELFFETLTLRKLPLTYGLRFISKLSEPEKEELAEFFLEVNLAF